MVLLVLLAVHRGHDRAFEPSTGSDCLQIFWSKAARRRMTTRCFPAAPTNRNLFCCRGRKPWRWVLTSHPILSPGASCLENFINQSSLPLLWNQINYIHRLSSRRSRIDRPGASFCISNPSQRAAETQRGLAHLKPRFRRRLPPAATPSNYGPLITALPQPLLPSLQLQSCCISYESSHTRDFSLPVSIMKVAISLLISFNWKWSIQSMPGMWPLSMQKDFNLNGRLLNQVQV